MDEDMAQEVLIGVWLPPTDWYDGDDAEEDHVP